jgi:hypothetical protein
MDRTGDLLIIAMFAILAVILAIGWWQNRQRRPRHKAVADSRSEPGVGIEPVIGNYDHWSGDRDDGPGDDGDGD